MITHDYLLYISLWALVMSFTTTLFSYYLSQLSHSTALQRSKKGFISIVRDVVVILVLFTSLS